MGILAAVVAVAACSSDPPSAPAASGRDDAAPTAEADQEAPSTQTTQQDKATLDDTDASRSGRDDAAPTAEADQEAPSTQTAEQDKAAPPGEAGARRFDIDQDTTLREVFDTLSGAEQSCIRGALDGDVLESMPDTPVLPDDPDGTGPSIFLCLAPDAAREFFLSVAMATMVAAAEEEGLSARMGKDEEACMRGLLAGVDVAALTSEPEPEGFEEFDVSGLVGVSDLSLGLFSCIPDAYVASMGDLTPEQGSCVRELMAAVAAGDYRSVLASDPELDALLESEPDLASLGPLLGLTFDVLSCLPDETDDSAPDDPTPEPDKPDNDPNTDPTPEPDKPDDIRNADPTPDPDETDDIRNADPTPDPDETDDIRNADPTPDPDETDDAAPDDHGDVLDRATPVGVGEAVPGAIDGDGDIDYFVFQAEQGMHYQIDVALGTLAGSTTTLHDDAAFELASYFENPSRDDYYDPYEASRLPWSAEYTGEHFVAVESFSGNTGKYTLTVVLDDHADVLDSATSVSVGETVPGAIDSEGDTDYFVFQAEEGMRYRIDVALGTLPGSLASLYGDSPYELTGEYNYTDASRIHWQADYTGDHYVAVRGPEGSTGTYTLTVTLYAFLDDHADVLDSATPVSVGETVPGAIDGDGDIDFFVFQAEEGMHYRIDVARGTLPGSDATLHHPDGYGLAHSDDYDTDTSRIDWRADYTGDHYVAVRVPQGETGYTGTYTLTVTPVADHADVLDSATPVSVGEAVPGAIDVEGDIDYFVFQAEQGLHYRIDVALGTLAGSDAELYHRDGHWLARNLDNDAASRIDWRADYTGDHYVAVRVPRGESGYTGTYTLTVTPVADHADVLDSATSVSVGEAVPGVIYHEGDIDFFVFRAEQGSRYQIDVARGTLEDSTVTLFDENSVELAFNDDYGDPAVSRVHWTSRIYWQAEYTGDHYVAVRSPYEDPGTYTLAVTVQ